MKRLAGKVTIVTGAGRGIGRSIAETFAREGAIVIATGRGADEQFAEGIEYHQLEVSEEAGWKRVVTDVLERHGRVDVLVNNAGVIVYDNVHELSLDDWNTVVGINQTGVWLGMREVIPAMLSNGAGSIVNISSIWGAAAVAGAHAYHATKGAVLTMSKSAAITYATQGIRVNSVLPGFIWTPLTENQDPDVNNYVIGQTPMGRAGQPEEIANGVLFLASDEASFVTGSELVIDGGYLAQ